MSHDPAGCPRSYCPECDAYGDGYIAGKTKAFSEVSAAVLHGGHAPDCGCQPCRVVAAVVMAVLHERMEVLDAALRDLEDAVPGRERTGEPALGQPGVQAPPEAAGATGVGFASRPGGVS